MKLTKELLAQLGAGDQFRIFYPESGDSHVAELISIMVQPRPAHNDEELLVEYKETMKVHGDSNTAVPEPERDGTYTTETSFDELRVIGAGNGFLEILNGPAEQVLMLAKSGSRAFIKFRPQPAIP